MPATFAQNENGLTYAADGFNPVKRWDAQTAAVEHSGVTPPTLAVALAGENDGPIFGTYFAYVRFVDRLGNVSNISPVSEPLVLDSVSGTITTMTNVTVSGATYTRLHSTGISSLLTNGNVVVIDGTNGMTGINGTWFYYADTNGDTDDFFLQASQAQVLATGTYTSGGTWTGPSGVITNAVHVTVAGVTYTRLSTSSSIWSTMTNGTTITLASIGGISGMAGAFAYQKDANGSTNDFFVSTFPTRVDAGAGPYTSGGTWHGAAVSLTNAVEVVEGAVDGTGTRYTLFTAPGIWAALPEGSPIQIAAVSGITGVNGDWVFNRALAPYGTTDDFTIATGTTKTLGVTPYTGGGTATGAATGSGTISAASDFFGPSPGFALFTRFTSSGSWATFSDGDEITIAGLSGLAADANGTWFFFKHVTTNTFWLSASNTGSPRFHSAEDSFTAGELSGNTRIRTAAFGPVAISKIEQVVDSFGPYSRLLVAGIGPGVVTGRQNGDTITLAGITGEFADLNGTWTYFQDLSAGGALNYFNIETGGEPINAVVTYTFGGTYAKAFGAITTASQVTVSGVTYTRITSAGIQSALTNGDSITVADVGGFAGLSGSWLYQADASGSTSQFYVTVVPVPVLGTGTYTSGGTWTGPSGTITGVSQVTVNDVTYSRLTGPGISVLLSDGNQITLAAIGGIAGLTGMFTYYADTNGAADTFYVQSSTSGVLGVGDYSGGASWNKGFGQINFSNVEVPTDSQITRKQILRNADGDTTTFYVDIDTDDLTATNLSSTRTDTELTGQEAVPLFDSNQVDLAVSRFSVPPDDLPLLLNARSRTLFSGSAVYSQGAVAVENGSAHVTGIGTDWTAALAERNLCVVGEVPAIVSNVDVTAQVLTLTEAWTGTTAPYADYSIRSGEERRRLVAWSEAGLPEAVPPTSSFPLTREGTAGDITAMFLLGPLTYLAEIARMHVFNFAVDPAPSIAGGDGAVFLHSYRGAVNQRCVIIVEDIAYILDQQGVHAVSAQGDQPLSGGVQDIFDLGSGYPYRINWTWSKFFHACHDSSQELLYWFVSMDCRKYPHQGIVFDYRGNRWWIEEYAVPVICSAPAQINGSPVTLIGSSGRRVFALGRGTTDGIDPSGCTVSGASTSSGLLSITDTQATFTADVVGLSVVIVAGTGQGQRRTIIAATATTLTVLEPWTEIPDTTSVYVIAGIDYQWKSGVFRFPPVDDQNPRVIELLGAPAASGTAELEIFFNRSETPAKWGGSVTDLGIATRRDDPVALLDLTHVFGIWRLRFDGLRTESLSGNRFLETQVAGVQASDPISFFEARVDGVTQ